MTYIDELAPKMMSEDKVAAAVKELLDTSFENETPNKLLLNTYFAALWCWELMSAEEATPRSPIPEPLESGEISKEGTAVVIGLR